MFDDTKGYYTRLYFLQGMRLLRRNSFWSLITAIVIALLLFVVYVMVAAAAHTRQAAHKIDDQLIVTAIITQDNETYKSVIPAPVIAEQVKQIPNVTDVHVVTEKETRDRFVKNLKDLKTVPAAWVFQEALEITVSDPDHLAAVRDQVSKLDGVEQATYLEALVKKLTAVSGYLRQLALGGALVLGLIAILIVMAVVRTAVHAERRSVATMASVGGSLWAIIAPMLVHLLAVTLVATAIACLAGWWVDPRIAGNLGGSIQDLPEWLRTGRAYPLGALFIPFALGACAAVSAIVCWGAWRYARPKI